MARPSFLTLWVLLLVSYLSLGIIGTLSEPARQNSLGLTGQDLQLQLLWLPKDSPLAPYIQVLAPTDLLVKTRDAYAEAYRVAKEDAPLDEDLGGLRVKLGILYAETNQVNQALPLWRGEGAVGQVLTQLYQNQPQPQAQSTLQTTLTGWYRQTTLKRLYRSTGQNLAPLQVQEQSRAQSTFWELLLLSGGQALLGLMGLGLLVREALLWRNGKRVWTQAEVPWSPEDGIWVVAGWITAFIFFLPFGVFGLRQGLIALPVASDLVTALTTALGYLAGIAVGLGLLWYKIGRFHPGAELFKIRATGLVWALGGYAASFPLLYVAVLFTQALTGDGGGGNQALVEILGAKNLLAQGLFLVTVSVLAPMFEEIIFRGVLFSSLSKLMNVPQAIVLSGLVFGAIHGSAAELLPLSVLGMILAYCYSQTRNLAVPILIHVVFNGVTFAALVILGGA